MLRQQLMEEASALRWEVVSDSSRVQQLQEKQAAAGGAGVIKLVELAVGGVAEALSLRQT